jgi:hypothetical protein
MSTQCRVSTSPPIPGAVVGPSPPEYLHPRDTIILKIPIHPIFPPIPTYMTYRITATICPDELPHIERQIGGHAELLSQNVQFVKKNTLEL